MPPELDSGNFCAARNLATSGASDKSHFRITRGVILQVRKILLPVEFHETTLRVIGVADAIARRFHSEIVLLHVIAPESYSSFDRPGTGRSRLTNCSANYSRTRKRTCTNRSARRSADCR